MTVRVGVLGLGYWGPNVARNLNAIDGAELTWCCETDEGRRQRWSGVFPKARFTGSPEEMLADDGLDAVAITAPTRDHAAVASQVLDAGKHCYVEKPLTHSVADAAMLVLKAEEKGVVLLVGHLLEYHPGIEALEERLKSGELGDLVYIYSNRLNLGKLRADENALWSLGAHDVSVVLHLAEEEPSEVDARGESYMRQGIEDVVFCYLRFPSGLVAHLHLSWLDPHKERRFTIVGSKRMATFDDMEIERKVTVYDKGFDQDYSSFGEYIQRSGDIWSPRISNEEPLRIECRHFLERVRDGTEPRSGPASGLRVVRVLEALERSLDQTSRAAPV